MPYAVRGGTTFGTTFVPEARDGENGPFVDPKVLYGDNVQDYEDLMAHEKAHKVQYDRLGPVPFGLMYFTDEAISQLVGEKAACFNRFERAADLEKGGYGNC